MHDAAFTIFELTIYGGWKHYHGEEMNTTTFSLLPECSYCCKCFISRRTAWSRIIMSLTRSGWWAPVVMRNMAWKQITKIKTLQPGFIALWDISRFLLPGPRVMNYSGLWTIPSYQCCALRCSVVIKNISWELATFELYDVRETPDLV